MVMEKILVEGIVQGVGFRPYVYRLANQMKIKGYVKNLGNIVEIVIDSNFENFKERLVNELPSIADINTIKTFNISDRHFDDFKIIKSSDSSIGNSTIPPDVAICGECLKEIRDCYNRRYKYPFNACTECGPRFSIIDNAPYDRINTSMNKFPLCDDCLDEYENSDDRRYHGEAICCNNCGPEISIYSKSKKINVGNPIKKAVEELGKGKIVAIKGIGGTHLAVNAYDDKAINKLRERLNRPNQAFAVMSRDLETVKQYAIMNESEKDIILSRQRPIVILNKKKNNDFPDCLTPGLHNIGVMLPYSPIHYLLFDESNIDTYIMTSANIPGEPMIIENKDIINLEMADYSLIHNREIINRCDDSVVRFRNDELSFIRRSRGYAPMPYKISEKYNINDFNVLALGPELDVTFSIATENLIYPSQHIGNTNNLKTLNFLKSAINNLENILKIDSYDLIVSDKHPNFFTTKLAHQIAEKYDYEFLEIQHHHAHAASLLNDNDLDEAVIIASDGVGYGDDKNIWGGEILYSDVKSYKRLASLEPQLMPGGDISTQYPVRMLASILSKQYNKEELEKILKNDYVDLFKYGSEEIDVILSQLENNFNMNITTSTGRVLDSISVGLGICSERTYEGECSMKLESVAYGAKGELDIPFTIENNQLNTSSIVKDAINLFHKGESKREIAAASQKSLAEGLAELAIRNAKNVDTIGVTGGVFYNEAISKYIRDYVLDNSYNFIQHKNTCAGDGSISLGQAIIAKTKKE